MSSRLFEWIKLVALVDEAPELLLEGGSIKSELYSLMREILCLIMSSVSTKRLVLSIILK